MKYRKTGPFRVAYGFYGRLQDDMEVYQGFMDVARQEGWQVLAVSEQFESRIRRYLASDALDAVVGRFISRSWLENLPGQPIAVHLGDAPLAGVDSVVPDMKKIGEQAADHLHQNGYEELWWYSPRRIPGVMQGMGEKVIRLQSRQALQTALTVWAGKKTGVLCQSDFYARQLIQLCAERSIEVPGHLGVLGIGDRFWDGVVAGLPISSVPLPYRRLGEAAAGILSDQLKGLPGRSVNISPDPIQSRESTRSPDHKNRLVDRVRSWWSVALADPASVEDLARRVGMSRRGFERAFRAEAGVTPYEMLLRLRTEKALQLLKETEWTVGRVGAEIGIPDPSRFSAFMKNRTGQAPSGLRKRP